MHVAIDIQSVVGLRSGVGQFTYHLARTLPALDPQNRYTLFLFDFRRRLRDYALEAGPARLLKVRVPGLLVSACWDLFRTPPVDAIVGKADLFHFPNYVIPPLAEGRAVASVYDVSFLRYPECASAHTLRWLDRNLERSLERADGIVTISEFSKAEIVELLGVPPWKVRVVYPGVSEAFRRPAPEADLARVRRRYGLPDCYLLAVGTLEPRKNLATLVKAFSIERAFFRSRRCGLVLAGARGWKAGPLFEQIGRQNLQEDVVVTGYVDDRDLPALYQGAAMLVFPSLYEGFGMPLLEAMASGLPVVASDTSSHREVLGEEAVFVSPHDPDSLARALKDLLLDQERRRALAASGTARAAQFTWERCARSMKEAYESFASGTVPGTRVD